MLLKNILLGLGGSAAIGGIGYGIYASSQSNEKEDGSSNAGSETSIGGGDFNADDKTETDAGEQTSSQKTQQSAGEPAPSAPSATSQGTGEEQDTGK